MTSAQIVPAIIVPFIAWRVYVRVRRNIGRQPFQPRRMVARVAIFSVVSVLVGLGALAYLPSLAALGGGLLLGVPLALVGLHLTRFETTEQGRFYTPNTAIGVALTVLLVGRMGYRMFSLFAALPLAGMPPPALFQSPLTLLIFGVTAGYYIAYYTGVLWRGPKPG
jgi:hypothetical protein